MWFLSFFGVKYLWNFLERQIDRERERRRDDVCTSAGSRDVLQPLTRAPNGWIQELHADVQPAWLDPSTAPSSTASLGASAACWIRRTDRTQTCAQVGCWSHKWQINLPYHNTDLKFSYILITFIFLMWFEWGPLPIKSQKTTGFYPIYIVYFFLLEMLHVWFLILIIFPVTQSLYAYRDFKFLMLKIQVFMPSVVAQWLKF